MTKEQETVLENISLAFVNGKITAAQAEQAREALIEQWKETRAN